MKLEGVASVSGKKGLFKIIKPTKAGVIVETLDEKKHRQFISAATRISLLKDISIYTNTAEGSVALEEVMGKLHEMYKGDTGIDAEAPNSELMGFLESILPDFNQDKVYPSDVKKLVNWYEILLQEAPGLFEEGNEEAGDQSGTDDKEETQASTGKTESKQPTSSGSK